MAQLRPSGRAHGPRSRSLTHASPASTHRPPRRCFSARSADSSTSTAGGSRTCSEVSVDARVRACHADLRRGMLRGHRASRRDSSAERARLRPGRVGCVLWALSAASQAQRLRRRASARARRSARLRPRQPRGGSCAGREGVPHGRTRASRGASACYMSGTRVSGGGASRAQIEKRACPTTLIAVTQRSNAP